MKGESWVLPNRKLTKYSAFVYQLLQGEPPLQPYSQGFSEDSSGDAKPILAHKGLSGAPNETAAYPDFRHLPLYTDGRVEMIERQWPYNRPPSRISLVLGHEIVVGERAALAFGPWGDPAWIVDELSLRDSRLMPPTPNSMDGFEQVVALLKHIANSQDTSSSVRPAKTTKYLSKIRAEAARGNRKVKNKDDRAKLKSAFRQKKTQSPDISDNQAAKDVAQLAVWVKDSENLLELNEQYPTLTADDVKRIAGVKR